MNTGGGRHMHPGVWCALLGMTGLLLGMLTVWLGTGWLDGFGGRDLDRLGRRFLRALPWALPLAALGGVLLQVYFHWAIGLRHKAWVGILGVVRAFALFPLLGCAILLAFVIGVLASIGFGTFRKLTGKSRERIKSAWLVTDLLQGPVWVLVLPFSLLKIESEGEFEIPRLVSRWRLMHWLPLLCLMLLLGPGFESENTGEYVDPNWLAALAGYWLADFLVVAAYVAPTLASGPRRPASADF